MRSRRSGFTLIELMIVVAIIAILSAIGIPSLLRSRMAANETSCQAALKQFVSTEAVWRQTGSSSDGLQDYWTRDVAGLYAWTDASGSTLQYVDVTIARADPIGAPSYPSLGTPIDKSGYAYVVMVLDENGNRYQQDPAGIGRPYSNLSKYGFCGIPRSYGNTGIREYIVNEMGVIYAKDVARWFTRRWPGTDPTAGGWTISE